MELNWPLIIFSLMITAFFYGLFPLLFAALRKKPITRARYRVINFIVNFFVMFLFIAVNGRSSGTPYAFWTIIYNGLGASILENRGILLGKMSKKNPSIQELKTAFLNTHKGCTDLLKRSPLVDNSSFETAVFLYFIADMFLYHAGLDTSIVSAELIPLVRSKCCAPWQEKIINSRIRLYNAVVNGRIPPVGIWLSGDLDENTQDDPFIRAQVLFGDLLIYPDCANDYEGFSFPVFSLFDINQFYQIFMSGQIINLLNNYTNALSNYATASDIRRK